MDALIDSVVGDCRKGKWIWIKCTNEKVYKKIVKSLKKQLYYGRGIFYQKGLVAVSVGDREIINIKFDRVEKYG